ncbi:CD3324 family protein [Paenibacillus pedocola]|uniref:CD3324 family protein n=1 Tax=Paenibacillus pedocola TaxID=3242193 RepID=UPI0028773360|nr:CD3324 family protein [Paenibacillus typhae]
MNYENAGNVLPEQLLKEIKKYAAGKLLYIPLDNEKKAWGEVSGYRHFLVRRNQFILNKFVHGIGIRELATEFHLSEETIKRIVYSRKDTSKLDYHPTSKSAMKYLEAGMLEEWLHTYLLFDRCNKVFSDGLRLMYRYYLGPLIMPLSLFKRSSGPEDHMKWQIQQDVFEDKVKYWMNQIDSQAETPPLIVNFEKGRLELNCNNPLLEALKRSQVNEHPIIIWITDLPDHDRFLEEYAGYQ